MADFWAAPPESAILFEVGFQAADDIAHKGIGDEREVRTLLGRTNRVLLGQPQTTDLLGSWPQNEALDPEIAAQRETSDFSMVRLACSFVPDRGCRFTWARLGLVLGVDGAEGTQDSGVVAVDVFPRDVIETHTYKRSFSIKPALKFSFVEPSVALGAESEVLQYEPRVTAAGLLSDRPMWTFSAPARLGVSGIREVFLLLRKPKSATVKVRFTVGVEVSAAFGPIPLKRYGDPAVIDREYQLA
jgi:hypothetical protein